MSSNGTGPGMTHPSAFSPQPFGDLASRAAGYAPAEEGRACRRQRPADAGGRSQGVARQARAASGHRPFVNQPAVGRCSRGHAAGWSGRCAPAGYGRARPAGGMPPAKSAVHGHGRPGWTPRASCPWASAHTPQENSGGVWASAENGRRRTGSSPPRPRRVRTPGPGDAPTPGRRPVTPADRRPAQRTRPRHRRRMPVEPWSG